MTRSLADVVPPFVRDAPPRARTRDASCDDEQTNEDIPRDARANSYARAPSAIVVVVDAIPRPVRRARV